MPARALLRHTANIRARLLRATRRPAFVLDAQNAAPAAVAALLEEHGVVVLRSLFAGDALDRVAKTLGALTDARLEQCDGVPLGAGRRRRFSVCCVSTIRPRRASSGDGENSPRPD